MVKKASERYCSWSRTHNGGDDDGEVAQNYRHTTDNWVNKEMQLWFIASFFDIGHIAGSHIEIVEVTCFFFLVLVLPLDRACQVNFL